MINKFIQLLFALLCASGIIVAKDAITLKGSPFAIDATKDINISWKGSPLVIGDSLSWISGETVGEHATTFVYGNHNGWQTSNAWNSDFILPYRREIGLSPNGKKIELTFQAHQEALMDEYPHPQISYKLILPASLFANASWDALTDAPERQLSNGRIDSSTPRG